jgi:hypothetical protein
LPTSKPAWQEIKIRVLNTESRVLIARDSKF